MLSESGLVAQHVPFSPILSPSLWDHLHTRGIDVARAEARTFVETPSAHPLDPAHPESRPAPGPGPAAHPRDFPGRTRNPEGLQGWF
jgi:hypothetical protein